MPDGGAAYGGMKDYLVDFCERMLVESGFVWTDQSVSVAALHEVVQFAQADLSRLELTLQSGVRREKFAAYFAYWFGRLEPVRNVYRAADDVSTEVVDISEQLAVHLAVELMLRSGGTSKPIVWSRCARKCTDGACFKHLVDKYFRAHDSHNYHYLVHQFRYQATEPTSLVSLLEALIIGACRDTSLDNKLGA